MSTKRKGPHSASPPLTTARMAELAVIIADQACVLGPQDEVDLVEALRELIEKRRLEEAIAKQFSQTQPQEAAA